MRIKEAAIRLQDGRVFTGRRHSDAFAAGHAAESNRLMVNQADQGFVTVCGRFVRRRAAGAIAFGAGQVKNLKWPHLGLNSEDLY